MAREGRKNNVECVKGFNVILISSLQTRFRWKKKERDESREESDRRRWWKLKWAKARRQGDEPENASLENLSLEIV